MYLFKRLILDRNLHSFQVNILHYFSASSLLTEAAVRGVLQEKVLLEIS